MRFSTTLEVPAQKAWLRSIAAIASDYVTLTKPRIISLLLITALGGMFLAARGVPPMGVMLWLLLGGAVAAGGANSMNHALDREVDGLMRRTRTRPVAGNRIGARVAFCQGLLLNAIAFGVLSTQVNFLSAALTLSATVFYVLVYTQWLKRSTPQNIVIGGAAGAIPPLAGWAAVTGGVGLEGIYLFAIIFFWTPPHFWALALLLKDDYARAGIPMLPVVRGVTETTRSIMLYSLLLVALTLMFYVVPGVGLVYFGFAVPLGFLLLLMSWRLVRTEGQAEARSLYIYSLLYLTLIFGGLMLDSTLAP